MTVLSGQSIRKTKLLEPMRERYLDKSGNSCGLSIAGYDLTLDSPHDVLIPAGGFALVSAAERFNLPPSIIGVVHDKSSLARRGIAVQNTIAEPGWRGYLTLEVTNHSRDNVILKPDHAIAQVVFHRLDEDAEHPYDGKYQDQVRGPHAAKAETT